MFSSASVRTRAFCCRSSSEETTPTLAGVHRSATGSLVAIVLEVGMKGRLSSTKTTSFSTAVGPSAGSSGPLSVPSAGSWASAQVVGMDNSPSEMQHATRRDRNAMVCSFLFSSGEFRLDSDLDLVRRRHQRQRDELALAAHEQAAVREAWHRPGLGLEQLVTGLFLVAARVGLDARQ